MVNLRNIEIANLRTLLKNGGAMHFAYMYADSELDKIEQEQRRLENRLALLEAEKFLNLTDEDVEQIRNLTGVKDDYELRCELEKIILEQNKE